MQQVFDLVMYNAEQMLLLSFTEDQTDKIADGPCSLNSQFPTVNAFVHNGMHAFVN